MFIKITPVWLLAVVLLIMFSVFSCNRRVKTSAAGDLIGWLSYADGAKISAHEGKHMLVYFWRPGCSWCAKMEKETYADSSVVNIVKDLFIPVKVNGWSEETFAMAEGQISGKLLADKFNLQRYPTIWFLESDGSQVNFWPGYAPPDEFKLLLKYVGENHYKSQNFKEYAQSQGRVF